ncbi:MAG TPA: hypothetical protein VI790_00025 [Candidatus Nanoarchaeia archaeon]|nr:hypothetical protein [Candidatus Nanoarchaeia archaeon]
MNNEQKNITIIGITITIILTSISIYSWYFSFEQRANRILSSNVTIDSKIIDDLKVNEWTSVAVILNQGNYTIDEVQNIILKTLSEKEFSSRYKFSTSAIISGSITIEGLEKLANNPIVKEIESGHGLTNISTEVRVQ